MERCKFGLTPFFSVQTMSNRVNIFNVSHKALRYALGKWSLMAGTTDCQNAESLTKLKKLTAELMLLLDSHSYSEESVILRSLEEKSKGSAKNNLEEHHRLEQELNLICELSDSITVNTTIDKLSELYKLINLFQSKYILHMHMEEETINQLLWAKFSDEELLKLHEEILDNLSPKLSQLWLRYIIPSVNPTEKLRL